MCVCVTDERKDRRPVEACDNEPLLACTQSCIMGDSRELRTAFPISSSMHLRYSDQLRVPHTALGHSISQKQNHTSRSPLICVCLFSPIPSEKIRCFPSSCSHVFMTPIQNRIHSLFCKRLFLIIRCYIYICLFSLCVCLIVFIVLGPGGCPEADLELSVALAIVTELCGIRAMLL